MRALLPASMVSAMMVAAPAHAQPAAGIPIQFHGRWAPSLGACADRGPSTRVVRIDARGWRSFEEGARIVRRIGARHGTSAFRTVSFGGADERPGTLALRLDRSRLILSETVAGRATQNSFVRCR